MAGSVVYSFTAGLMVLTLGLKRDGEGPSDGLVYRAPNRIESESCVDATLDIAVVICCDGIC